MVEELQLLALTWMDNKVQQPKAMEMEMEWQRGWVDWVSGENLVSLVLQPPPPS